MNYALRPIVSINLKNSGYNLVKNNDNENYELIKENI